MIDKKYKDYLNGKKVALVGLDEYLTKFNTVKYIDPFDVVVRVNRGTEAIDRYFNSIGRRTDILYTCLIKSPDNGSDIKVKEYKKNKIKWIATTPNPYIDEASKSIQLHKMVS